MQGLPDHLSISDVAERTGIGEPALRMWETRYGFPRPERTPSGHRRDSEEDVAGLAEVLRLRDEGLALRAAIDRVARAAPAGEPSVFAFVRRATGLAPQPFPKPAMVRISQAMEDEVLQQRDCVLVGGFQARRHLEASMPRWRDFARTARACVTFAEGVEPTDGRPAMVPIESADALVREWFLAGFGPDCAVALSAWERPQRRPRTFECVWTADRDVVREVLEWAATRAEPHAPQAAGRMRDALEPGGARGEAQLRALEALSSRMLRYVAGAPR